MIKTRYKFIYNKKKRIENQNIHYILLIIIINQKNILKESIIISIHKSINN